MKTRTQTMQFGWRGTRAAAVLILGVALAATATVQGALVLHWQMENPSPLEDSVGSNDLVAPGGAASPTHLPTGGANASGAFQFSGAQYFDPTTSPTSLGAIESDWTASFWISTTDTGSAFLLKVPVFGDPSGATVGFSLGVDAGKAAFRHWDSGWHSEGGTANVADGSGHFITFVHHDTGVGTGTMDIYVDGVPDTLDINAHDGGSAFPYNFTSIGRTHSGPLFANMILDDVSIFNTALTAQEIFQLANPVPEPTTLALAAVGAALLVARRRRM